MIKGFFITQTFLPILMFFTLVTTRKRQKKFTQKTIISVTITYISSYNIKYL